ncbi:MAG: ABC transporter permease [Chloroflexota bacterium]
MIADALPGVRGHGQPVNRVARTVAGLLDFARRKPLGAFGALCIAIMVAAAVLAEVISPYDPIATAPQFRLRPPGPQFWFGSDELGRDLFSRVVHGARTSLYVGIATIGLSITIGTVLGTLSGFLRGTFDLIVQRLVDVMMPIPLIVLAMTLLTMLGASRENVIVSLAIVLVPINARVIRGATLSVVETAYIESARAIGCSVLRTIWVHVLPNVAAPIMILASIQLGTAIVAEASLSFLGVGTPPPTPTWGGMLSGSGRRFMQTAPWLLAFPAVAISLAVLGFNLLGDALRDVWDPRLRNTG